MFPIPPNEKLIETKSCKHCGIAFPVTDKDVEFLEKLTPKIGGKSYTLPTPSRCPKCRKIRRYAWRNEHKVFKRKCDATGKDIISLFAPDTKSPVYESSYWYSDKWDAREYASDFDFSRPFFEQWEELHRKVPLPGKIISLEMENSTYSDNCGNMKDCYLCFNATDCDNCHYSNDVFKCKDSLDSIGIAGCHENYELIKSDNCYNTFFSFDIKNCQYSSFLYSCIACQYCYGCYGLKNKKYHIFNKSYVESTYFNELGKIKNLPIEIQKDKIENFLMVESYTKQIQQSMSVENIVYSTGVDNSKNIYFSKDIRDSESIRYSGGLYQAQDVMDVDIWGHGLAISYDSHIVGESANNIYFCLDVWGHASNMYYSLFCMNNVDNCFGCIGLKNAKYCILNKQYTKEQHEELVPRIISHMMKTGEWGEFFPVGFSHFAYNHTLNMDKYPISKTDAIAQGFTWSDYEPPFPQVDKIIPAEKLPENIEDIPDDILAWAIECEVTKKPFRIIRQELEFYRKHHLPIPRRHPDQRYKERTKVYINY